MGISRYTLRFNETVAEDGFVRSRARALATNLFWCCLNVATICGLSFIGNFYELSSEKRQVAQEKMFWVRLGLMGSATMVTIMVMIFTRIPRYFHCISFEKQELVATLLLIWWSCVAIMNNSYYACVIWGQDPFVVYSGRDCFNDSRTLLALDAIITFSHICLPIRWCFLVFLDLSTLLLYTMVCFGIDGPEKPSLSLTSWIFLVGLIFLAAFGKRQMECVERDMFEMLADEKTRRVGLEFELSNVVCDAVAPKSHDESSRPSTTDTGKLFNLELEAEGEDAGEELATRLGRLLELGSRQQWLIDTGELALSSKIIGNGSFGFVVEGEYYGTKVAVKIPFGAPRCDSLSNELRVMRQLRHQHIVYFHGACVEPEHGRLALVLEFLQGTRLDVFVCKEAASLGARERRQISNGICSALCYLHTRKPAIVHGDVSGSNVMVELGVNYIHPKLLDFGLSRIITKNAKSMGGTLRFKAPEIIWERTLPSTAADVFSFGRILFLVTTGTLPLQGLARQEIIDLSRDGSPQISWPARTKYSVLWNIAQKCMLSDPRDRPGIAAVFAGLTQKPEECRVSLADPWNFDWGLAYPRLEAAAKAKHKKNRHHTVLPKIYEEPWHGDQTNEDCEQKDSYANGKCGDIERADILSDFDSTSFASDDQRPTGELVLAEVSVDFDLLSPSLTLEGYTMKFRRREETSLSAVRLECTSLADLVPAKVLAYIDTVSQENVNKSFAGDAGLISTQIEAVPHVPPQINCNACSTLYAESCQLDVPRAYAAPVCLTWHELSQLPYGRCSKGSKPKQTSQTRPWTAGTRYNL